MRITNKAGLPGPLVAMAMENNYPPVDGVYRVTSLLKGTREAILERRHWDEIEKDVSELIYTAHGSAMHAALERFQAGGKASQEARMSQPIGDYTLSGQYDLYEPEKRLLTDYKTTSVWKFIFADFADWRRQLLMYAWLLRQQGEPVDRAQIVAFLKDHVKAKALYDKTYPQYPIQTVDFIFTADDFAECEAWLQEKFAEIARCEKLPDDELPVCTPEERWNRSEKWAVMKRGRKKALKLCDSEDEAKEWRANFGGDLIEYRPGQDRKCDDYCNVNCFCSYYRNKNQYANMEVQNGEFI